MALGPTLQDIAVGTVFPAAPGVTDGFFAAFVHRLMERKQLLGIAQRVESWTESGPGRSELEGRRDQRRTG